MQVTARIDETREWVRCGKCGHKLFKIDKNSDNKIDGIEIKCHSCKTVNKVDGREESE